MSSMDKCQQCQEPETAAAHRRVEDCWVCRNTGWGTLSTYHHVFVADVCADPDCGREREHFLHTTTGDKCLAGGPCSYPEDHHAFVEQGGRSIYDDDWDDESKVEDDDWNDSKIEAIEEAWPVESAYKLFADGGGVLIRATRGNQTIRVEVSPEALALMGYTTPSLSARAASNTPEIDAGRFIKVTKEEAF